MPNKTLTRHCRFCKAEFQTARVSASYCPICAKAAVWTNKGTAKRRAEEIGRDWNAWLKEGWVYA